MVLVTLLGNLFICYQYACSTVMMVAKATETCGRLMILINPYPTAFPYGNGMVLHFYQQQESSTTKTVHKVINKGLKSYVESPHTGENWH